MYVSCVYVYVYVLKHKPCSITTHYVGSEKWVKFYFSQ